MSRTGLTEEATWYLSGVASLFDFLEGLQFDKFGNLREGHIVHFQLGSKRFVVRLNAGQGLDDVYRSVGERIPVKLPMRRRTVLVNPGGSSDHVSPADKAREWTEPPRVGELIVCVFVPADRQRDRLADFEEVFRLVWQPRFGWRLARWVYIAQAIRSAGAVVRIAAVSALADWVMRMFGH